MTSASTPQPASQDPGSGTSAPATEAAAPTADAYAQVYAAYQAAEQRAVAEQTARAAAEARVRDLESHIAALEEERSSLIDEVQAGQLSIFAGPHEDVERGLAPDGSDPRLLGLGLAGTALVAGIATLLALVNGRGVFAVVMAIVTFSLAYWANKTWVAPVEISVIRGVVYIEQGEQKHRFDLRQDKTHVAMKGQPGSGNWELRFSRDGHDAFTVRAGMVDPHRFVQQLREHRPEL